MKRYLSLVAFVLMTAVGCNDSDPALSTSSADFCEGNTKIINSRENASEGKLIINVNDRIAEALENGDVSFLDNLHDVIGKAGIKRVFPVVERTESRAREYGLHRWYVVSFADDVDLEAASSGLAGLGEVNKVQYCTVMRKASDGISHQYEAAVTKSASQVSSVMNDPYSADQWHYTNDGNADVSPTAKVGADINVADAWRLCPGDKSVIVAVLDEGVQYDHPDLRDNMWVNPRPGEGGYENDNFGYNFVGNGGEIEWLGKGNTGHGTHVAGTVAAVNNNGTGVCGVAGGDGHGNGVRIMSCQIFSGFDGGTPEVIAEAAKYAADHGASILQCSFGVKAGAYDNDNGYQKDNSVEHAAFKYFMEKSNCSAMDGGLVIFAAGNDGEPVAGYPGAYRDFICVTSFAADNLPAYYTNYGPGSNVSAPGGEYGTGMKYYDEADQKMRSEVLSTMPTKSFTLYVKDVYGYIYNAGKTAAKYGYMEGTSMACPHVSGVAALGLSYALKLGKHYSRNEMTSMILTSTDDIDSWMYGTKTSLVDGTMNLTGYRGNMGTGSINAWKLLMQIEGTPCIMAGIGEELVIDLAEYFGGNVSEMTFLGVTMSPEDMEALGLEAVPEIASGKLSIIPGRAGSAKLTVKAIAGGSSLGGNNDIGGMEISRDISVMSRSISNDNGGWL